MPTLERDAFKSGLYREVAEQSSRYCNLLEQLFELEARVQVNERTLKATRDHLMAAIDESEGDIPEEWEALLHSLRFLGVRLADACLEVLRDRGRLTTNELLNELNTGQFRFRTPSPLREINAAMMRQRNVRRDGDMWIYDPPSARRDKERKVSQIA